MIGDDIVVQVVEIGDGRVRLGFSAPKSILIHREEVFDEIQRKKEIGQSGGDNQGNK
jgi:carbon storage regulator